MNNNWKALIVVVLWIVLALGLILFKEFTLQTGTTILLKTQPVDPRDLFRGDYVTLNYQISRVQTKETEWNPGDTAYVYLTHDGKYSIVDHVSKVKEVSTLPFLKARVQWFDNFGIPFRKIEQAPLPHPTLSPQLNVQYGIESYFVPEGQGKFLERARKIGRAHV